MFFEATSDIEKLAERAETAVFALPLPDLTEVGIKPYYILEPNSDGKIPIEAARSLVQACMVRQEKTTFVIIDRPETMLDYVQNTLLKLLEEPRENYHYLIFTENPGALLPTIRSRAEIYYPLRRDVLSAPVSADEKVADFARRILRAKPADLVPLSEEINKKKDKARSFALDALVAAAEIAYKSYFATSNPAFLKKLPKIMDCYANIKGGGHIKLHIVADL